MKRILCILSIIIALPLVAQAQVVVNGQDVNQLAEVKYIELIVDRRIFQQGEVFAVIDYGQVIRAITFRQHRVRDEQGRDRRFGSEMDIFNFLHKNGWIHETTYAVGEEGYVYHIFRRKGTATIVSE